MKRVVSCTEMKALDSGTIVNKGIPSCVLMERAALKVAEIIELKCESDKNQEKILCVCGSGNNGGDGVALARILYLHGYDVTIYLAGNSVHQTSEMSRQIKIANSYNVPFADDMDFGRYSVIVDAIFGVGLSRPIEGKYKEIIDAINNISAYKVAVDIPSGINGNTGEILGTAFKADVTVTFAYKKIGLCLYPGRKIAGEVIVADVGIYGNENEDPDYMEVEPRDIKLLPEHVPDGNKSTFGKVLIVAGSHGMCGASYLCANGAFAAGAGMVQILTCEENRIPLQTMLPEAMVNCSEDEKGWQKVFDWCDVVTVGPGIGFSEESRQKVVWFLKEAKRTGKTIVVDADALNIIAQNPELYEYIDRNVILTPHIGEMHRLSGLRIDEIQRDRMSAAMKTSLKSKAVCVLKDASTVVADSNGKIYFSLAGNSGMATAGSGDTLTGIIAGISGRSSKLKDAKTDLAKIAAVSVLLHGMAGDFAADEIGRSGMKASDIAAYTSKILKQYE